MAKGKIKKAILAGLTAYAASKMMGKGSLKGDASKLVEGDIGGKAKQKFVEDIGSYKHKHLPPMKGHPGGWNWESKTFSTPKGGSVPKTWKDWIPWLKKHGGSITNARLGKMIKAAQGTYAREDESLGMRLGKGKGTAKERNMSYGKWGSRKTDWAKSGKMIKARHGTMVTGGTAYVRTKLNGTLKTKTY
tara:strand:+ start:129 stop:698 length:570 start_codon:yes stop_codon:yes gene_type:complete